MVYPGALQARNAGPAGGFCHGLGPVSYTHLDVYKRQVVNNLRTSDPYMVMADFKDYRRAQADVQKLYADRTRWNQMSLANIANSGIFSADRSVMDYARDIWGANPVK